MSNNPMAGPADLPRHPVRVVSARTGLTTHVLRAWERRYGVVSPTRTEGGQRLYSDADIERLSLLQALTAAGESISQLAQHPIAELRRLAEASRAVPMTPVEARDAEVWLQAALRAIETLDAPGLRHGLERGAVALGVPRLLDDVVSPMLVEIGERWRAGRMTIAQEHLAMSVVREVLGWVRDMAETRGAAPAIVVATPPGQMHEGGAQMVATAAASEGWRVTYLGADLPIAEIAEAARRTAARAVALSIVHPADDPAVGGHIRALRRALPADVALLVGGGAATAYAEEAEAADAEVMTDLASLRQALRSLGAEAAAS